MIEAQFGFNILVHKLPAEFRPVQLNCMKGGVALRPTSSLRHCCVQKIKARFMLHVPEWVFNDKLSMCLKEHVGNQSAKPQRDNSLFNLISEERRWREVFVKSRWVFDILWLTSSTEVHCGVFTF